MKSSDTVHIILFLFVAQFGFGQNSDRKTIVGQVLVQSNMVEGINVINNTTQATTLTDSNGKFSVAIKEGDVLVFSAVNLEPLKRRITAEDLVLDKLLINMATNEIELKEVVVNENARITTENLGIVPRGQKTYTPAERKLAVAGDFKAVDLLGLLGGSFKLDPFLNKINGRTKKLKELVEVERKEMNIEQLSNLFEDAYFVDYLKIPAEYVLGFKFYFVESQNLNTLLTEGNKSKLALLMAESALKYNDIISSEDK